MASYNERILGIRNPYARAYFKYIWRQVHINNFGSFGVVTGLPGMSKSYTTLLEMWFQDMDFNEDNLNEKYVWSPKAFLKFINASDKYEWAAWDETGITLSSKKWATPYNILTEDAIQVMRIRKLGIRFCSQMVSFIDNRARSLFQTYTEVKRWERNPPFWKIHRVDMNQLEGKIYFPYYIFNINGNYAKLKGIHLHTMVNDKLKDKFEEMHTAWKEELLKHHGRTLEKIELEDHEYDIWEMIEMVQNEKKKYTNAKNKLDSDLIMTILNIGKPRAVQIVKFIEKNAGSKPVEPRKAQ